MNSVIAHYRMTRLFFVLTCLLASPAVADPISPSTSGNRVVELGASEGRSLVARGSGTVGISVARSANADQVAILTGAEKPVYKVIRLSTPPRLVIDLISQKQTVSKTLAVADLDHVSAIRLGAHPTSGRIVMDLSQGQEVAHSIKEESGKIIVTLTTSSPVPVNTQAQKLAGAEAQRVKVLIDEAKPILPKLQIENAAIPSSLGDVFNGTNKNVVDAPLQGQSPKLRNARSLTDDALKPSVVPVVAKASTAGSLVKGVQLSSADGESNSVLIDVDKAPEFMIQRTAPSEYVITLKNTGLSDNTSGAPILASSKSSTIRSVRSSANGKDSVLRIFTRPDVYLTARLAGTRIVVEETKDLRRVVDDMRAQLAPDTTPTAAPSVEKKPEPQAASSEPSKASNPQKSSDPVAAPQSPSSEPKKAGNPQKPSDPVTAAKGSAPSKKADVEEMSDSEVRALLGDTARYTGKLISLDLQDTDIDNALRIIAEVSNLNIVASEEVVGKVTLRLTDVPWDQALDVILKTHGLDRVLEGNVMRIAPVDKLALERKSQKEAQLAEAELAPLNVKYIRVSYGKAAELKSLVETVLSERGSVAYDDRSNQLIVKDIPVGISNVTELVSKVDLRTPQVLLETQIVEATRDISRTLGSELGFQYIQSPATGNGTGLNFPSAISVGGSVIPGGATPNITTSSFPAVTSALGGSAISMLFDSADGTKTLELRLSQLEQEGKVRIVSRPSVATTNNKKAEIKSVEKYRVKFPDGGTSVATGQGSTAVGTSGSATEVIEAGIVLEVTPQASPDYYILLDIFAKSSSFGAKEVDGIPNEISRSASSSVLVSSGQTFALGGIYKITESDTVAGMPFFKDIPVLGTFFRRVSTSSADEELLFFITPRIVEGSFDDSSMKVSS